MDVSTAKTLVSAILVFAILVFSVVSFKMIVSEIRHDLKGVRAQRVAAKASVMAKPSAFAGSAADGTPEA